MQTRPATLEDKPAIIDLLRKSLGESTIPKSEALWNWKHVENPFGSSYVLLAEENNTMIGLRAFMKWDWQWNGTTYNAIRAVDTATHPEHQGKGIFKKLTLQQLDECKKLGTHFVFNTPNEQSRPGYLKMGWVQQGKMPLKFKIRNPLTLAYAKVFKKPASDEVYQDPTPHQDWSQLDLNFTRQYVFNKAQLTTVISPEYIKWRYATNPLFRYNFITDHQNFILISRVKKFSFTKEFRIVDFILTNKKADPKAISKYINKAVMHFCKENNINLISVSGAQYPFFKPYFSWMGFLPVKPLGPIVTLKEINMNEKFQSLLDVNNWCYTLGDMELF